MLHPATPVLVLAVLGKNCLHPIDDCGGKLVYRSCCLEYGRPLTFGPTRKPIIECQDAKGSPID